MKKKTQRHRDTYIIVRVSKAERQSVKALAEQRGVSMSDMIRAALASQQDR